MTRTTTPAASLVALFASFAISDVADARYKQFKGTRAQVRAACAAQGGELFEGVDMTWCGKGSNSVTCWDDGNCTGKYSLSSQRHDAVVEPVESDEAGPGLPPKFGKPGLE